MKQLEKKKRIRTKKILNKNQFPILNNEMISLVESQVAIALRKELNEKNNLIKKQTIIEPAEIKKSVNGHTEMEHYYKSLQVYAELGSRLESTVNRLVKLPSLSVTEGKDEPLSCFADVLANNNNIFASYNNRLERLLTTLETFI